MLCDEDLDDDEGTIVITHLVAFVLALFPGIKEHCQIPTSLYLQPICVHNYVFPRVPIMKVCVCFTQYKAVLVMVLGAISVAVVFERPHPQVIRTHNALPDSEPLGSVELM